MSGTAAPPAQEEEAAGCHCTKESVPTIICVLAIMSNVLMGVAAVLSLMQFEGGVKGVILNVYVVVLSTLGLILELRILKFLRVMIWYVVRFVYFLTNYKARALYYIFVGSLNFDYEKPLLVISSSVQIALGIAIIICDIKFGLPTYIDPQYVKEQQERKLRQLERRIMEGQTPRNSAGGPEAKQDAYQPPDRA